MKPTREDIRRILICIDAETLEVIQEVANAILDDRGAMAISPRELEDDKDKETTRLTEKMG